MMDGSSVSGHLLAGGGGWGRGALCDETKTAVKETTEGRNDILNKYSLKSR